MAGVEFWLEKNEQIANGSKSMVDAFSDFLIGIQPKNPEEAPNYDYIPHVVDNHVPRNFTHIGYIGETLKQKAKAAYCSKSQEVKDKIKEAHQKIHPSSHP